MGRQSFFCKKRFYKNAVYELEIKNKLAEQGKIHVDRESLARMKRRGSQFQKIAEDRLTAEGH